MATQLGHWKVSRLGTENQCSTYFEKTSLRNVVASNSCHPIGCKKLMLIMVSNSIQRAKYYHYREILKLNMSMAMASKAASSEAESVASK